MLQFKSLPASVSPWALCGWGSSSAVGHEALEMACLMRVGNSFITLASKSLILGLKRTLVL